MSYKKEASSAHKSKLKCYADGGGIEASSPSLLDMVQAGLTKELAGREDHDLGEAEHDIEDAEGDALAEDVLE